MNTPFPADFKFHHVAFAVNDIDETTRTLGVCGYTLCPDYPPLVVDEALGVKLRFLSLAQGGPLLELVCGLGDTSPVAQILQKSGVTLYHMCFEVNDIEQAFVLLKQQGYVAVSKRIPAKAFGDRLIQFLYHKDGGLVELLAAS